MEKKSKIKKITDKMGTLITLYYKDYLMFIINYCVIILRKSMDKFQIQYKKGFY